MEDRIEGSQTAYSHHSGCCDAGLSSAGFPSNFCFLAFEFGEGKSFEKAGFRSLCSGLGDDSALASSGFRVSGI